MTRTAPPWSALPSDIATSLRPHLDAVVREVIAALPIEVPDYARPLEGAFGDGVRMGVEVALGRFLELPGTSEPALRAQDRKVYLALGRGELRQGRELQTLLSAYRVGARVAFRRFAALAREGGYDADALVQLAESVFAYIDELSSTSVEGYAQEQSLRAGETDRRRGELMALLFSGPVDERAAAAAAALAGWTVPETVLAVVVPADRAEGLGIRLGRQALVAPYGEAVVAVVTAPARSVDRAHLTRQLHGRGAVLGPARRWSEVRGSLRLATLGARLVEAGVLAGDPVWIDAHLADLVVHQDPDLMAELAAVRLAPLQRVRESSRERLAETLLAWLQHRGERQHIAAALHVHPQTVGYRLGQLRTLFGEVLEDPQGRFELELALRARR